MTLSHCQRLGGLLGGIKGQPGFMVEKSDGPVDGLEVLGVNGRKGFNVFKKTPGGSESPLKTACSSSCT